MPFDFGKFLQAFPWVNPAHVMRPKAGPGEGTCTYSRQHSGLRKLQRAMNRGTLPGELLNIIDLAVNSAHKRRAKYMHSHRRRYGS